MVPLWTPSWREKAGSSSLIGSKRGKSVAVFSLSMSQTHVDAGNSTKTSSPPILQREEWISRIHSKLHGKQGKRNASSSPLRAS